MNASEKNILFIINKFAGTGYHENLEKTILQKCKKNNIKYSIAFTAGKGHATTLAQSGRDENFSTVVAVGGDGTLNGVVHSHTTMGIIPRGSGNGLARHLGIPLDFAAALDVLLYGKVIKMDSFTINNKLSLNVSGIGFDGHIANSFGKDGRRGFAAYARLSVEQYVRYKEFETIVSANGIQIRKNAFMIAIANSSQYGNNARIAPHASVCDQILHINFLNKIPLYRLDLIYSFFKGTIDKSEFYQLIETDAMQIKSLQPIYYHVDGEPMGQETNFDIKILPASLHMTVPKTGVSNAV